MGDLRDRRQRVTFLFFFISSYASVCARANTVKWNIRCLFSSLSQWKNLKQHKCGLSQRKHMSTQGSIAANITTSQPQNNPLFFFSVYAHNPNWTSQLKFRKKKCPNIMSRLCFSLLTIKKKYVSQTFSIKINLEKQDHLRDRIHRKW